MKEIIDFTSCPRNNNFTYNGANGKKIAVSYQNEIYMLKFPSLAKNNNLSYSNNIYSEYISCHIYSLLGFNTQETILGKYLYNNEEKIVCACKDFTNETTVIADFASLKNSIINSDSNGYGTELEDIVDTINKQDIYDKEKLLIFFWDMFIVDSLLGNFDRHNGNWGFLHDKKNNNISLAPIYDCGSCLLPELDDDTLVKTLEDKEEMNKRIYVFPNSAIKYHDKKINPYQFINSLENKDCNAALLRIYPKIDISKIKEMIDNTLYLNETRKLFYKTYIEERYNKILGEAYYKLKNSND